MTPEKQVLDALLDQYFLAPDDDDDPLAGLDFGALPWPKAIHRHRRSFSQRDVTRALRGAQAAGAPVRVVIEEGRISLIPTMTPISEMITSNPWAKFRHG